MTPNDLRQKYIAFFVQRGHVNIPSASLVPDNDPTTLFTSSGMQPLVPYLLGQPHPAGKKLVDSQKSFRSQDIEEVGDNRHTTFFEMLGNWSLGEYFKQEQLDWFFTFLTDELGLDPQKLFVTVFAGNEQVGRDEESVAIWKTLFAKKGITAEAVDPSIEGMDINLGDRIFYYSDKKNWWSRAGVPTNMPVGEPGGPDSEVFYDFGAELGLHEQSAFVASPCHVNCDCGRFLEIGNNVFMQFQKQADGSFAELPQKNVDFGGGFERILAAVENSPDIFQTSLFAPIISAIEQVTGKKYNNDEYTKGMRIIADHARAAVFLLGDGVLPSNKEQGYVARRLIRRAVRIGKILGIQSSFLPIIGEVVMQQYADIYFQDPAQNQQIISALNDEEERFAKTISKGLKEIEKVAELDGQKAFQLYETYGFPFELTEEIARERGQQVEYGTFREEFEKHQQLSRTAAKGTFKGGLADSSEQVTKYHTATHLLHAALRKVLGKEVSQQGSNITSERLRFDFSFSRAVTVKELEEVQTWMNEAVQQDLPVHHSLMSKDVAIQQGAMAFFREKYGDEVSVYTIGKEENQGWISKELCGGPHVTHTGEIGPLQIIKEEAIGAGKRRIYVKNKV